MDADKFTETLDSLVAIIAELAPDSANFEGLLAAPELPRAIELSRELLEYAANPDQLRALLSDESRVLGLQLHLLARVAEAAAIAEAAGRSREARSVLERCLAISTEHQPPAQHEEGDVAVYRAAVARPADYTMLCLSRWHLAHDSHETARALAAKLTGPSTDPALAKIARSIEALPKPLKSAPSLFTFNGFGFTIHGRRDVAEDGSYITTRFITGLFIPLIPLDAFRVRDAGENCYNFMGKVPLGLPARLWRCGMAALVAGAIIWSSASSYLDSPKRQMRLAMDDAAAMADAGEGDPGAALDAYQDIAEDYAWVADVPAEQWQDFFARWLPLATRDIPEPMTLAALPSTKPMLARFEAMPAPLINGEAAGPVIDQITAWAEELEGEGEAAIDARLSLLAVALRHARGEREQAAKAQIEATRIALAKILEDQWPLEALRQYDALGDNRAAVEAIAELLETVPQDPILLLDVQLELQAWIFRIDRLSLSGAELERTQAKVSALLGTGAELETNLGRTSLLASADEAAIRAVLRGAPFPDPNPEVEVEPDTAKEATAKELIPEGPAEVYGDAEFLGAQEGAPDQELVAALAAGLRARGALDEAAALLDALGPPGHTTHEVQSLRAAIFSDQGQLDEAAERLGSILDSRMPAFDDVRRRYYTRLDALQAKLIERAERGSIPDAYQADLTSEDLATAQAGFSRWLDAEIESDFELARLRELHEQRTDVVSVAILLGSTQLERAGARTGEERQRLLDSAEQAFLAIQGEASGLPEYHASLGQVYHRLGKTQAGDAELAHLVDSPDLHQRLFAASIYRDLGQKVRAIAIAEALYDAADDDELRQTTAGLLAMTVFKLDDRQRWLERSDTSQPSVRANILEVEGDRLLLEGELEAADAKFAESFEIYALRMAEHASAANNAALALRSRYACTGDLEHVTQATGLLAHAVEVEPDNGILLSNYGHQLDLQSRLDLLDTLLPVADLRPNASEASLLLDALSKGDSGESMRAALVRKGSRQRTIDAHRRAYAMSPANTDGLTSQQWWFNLAQDATELSRLADELDGSPPDTRTDAVLWASAMAGDYDALMAESTDAELRRCVVQRERVEGLRESPPKTRAKLLAAVELSCGATLKRRAMLTASVDDAQAAVAAHERANQHWPEAFGLSTLVDAHLSLAITQRIQDDPALGPRWRERIAHLGITVFLIGLVETEDPGLSGLAAHPSMARAAELLEALDDDQLPPLTALTVGHFTKNTRLLTRARSVLAVPRHAADRRISALILDYDSNEGTARAFIDAQLVEN